jgi:alpha-glucosidase
VPNHTSDQHPWFQESRAVARQSRSATGTSGATRARRRAAEQLGVRLRRPAWEFDEATGQYYLHSFLREQPDLNWRNPEVVRAMHDVLRFWLDRGVDGFRIDVIHRIAKDPELRDNPVRPEAAATAGSSTCTTRTIQTCTRCCAGPAPLLDGYRERMMVGEVYLFDPAAVARYYGRGDELHLAFNFSFLRCPWGPGRFRGGRALRSAVPARGLARLGSLQPRRPAPRVALRRSRPRRRARPGGGHDAHARCFLYYGEEIGMRNVEIPPERLQDPLARTLHPNVSRDPERTPLPWEPEPGAGFTTGEPWLPLGPDVATRNVATARADRASLPWLYRDLITLRRAVPALHRGSFALLDAPEDVFAFERRHGAQGAFVALNFGSKERRLSLGRGAPARGLSTRHGAPLPHDLSELVLGPCEGLVLVQP